MKARFTSLAGIAKSRSFSALLAGLIVAVCANAHAAVTLTVGDGNEVAGDFEIGIDTGGAEVGGVQFVVTGLTSGPGNGDGGLAHVADWSVSGSSGSDTVIMVPRSATNPLTINGSGMLSRIVGLTSPGTQVCLTEIHVSDETGDVDLPITPGAVCGIPFPNGAPEFATVFPPSTGLAGFWPFDAPSEVPTVGLRLHLDASDAESVIADGSGVVETWHDRSGQANDAVQSLTSRRPTYVENALNGRAVVRFDGTNDHLILGDIGNDFSTAAHVFVVATVADNNYNLFTTRNNNTWWCEGGSTSNPGVFRSTALTNYSTNMPNSGTHIFAIESSASGWEMSIDGVSQGAGAAGYNQGNAFKIAAPDDSNSLKYLTGDIAEILVYNRILSDSEELQIAAYLSSRYDVATSAPIIDYSGNGYNGTSFNGASLSIDGARGSVLSLDGSNDYVTIDAVVPDLVGTDFSVFAFANSDGVTGLADDLVALNRSNRFNRMRLSMQPDGKLYVYDGSWEGSPVTVVDDNTWRYLGFTFDYASSEATAYVDGNVEWGPSLLNGLVTNPIAGSDLASIGQEWDGSGPSNYFDGQLDNVAIFDRALLPAEVSAISSGYVAVQEDATYSYPIVVRDSNPGDTFDIVQTAPGSPPAWMDFAHPGTGPNATFTAQPVNAHVGSYTVSIEATDQGGSGIAVTQTTTLVVVNVDDPPSIDSSAASATPAPANQAIEDSGAVEGAAYTYAAVGSDPDLANPGPALNADSHLTWSFTGSRQSDAAPASNWLLLDSPAGTNTELRNKAGFPKNEDVGYWDITLTLTDSTGLTDTQQFTVIVINTNDPPSCSVAGLTLAEGDLSVPLVNASHLTCTDPDVGDGADLRYDITVSPSGEGTLNGLSSGGLGFFLQSQLEGGSISYSHLGGEGTSHPTEDEFFWFTVTDVPGSVGGPYKFPINVTPVDDAPINAVPGARTVLEGGTLDFGTAVNVTDTDAAGDDITTRLEVSVNGVLTATPTAGLVITGNGSNDVLLTGTVTQINAGLTGLTYAPQGDFNGSDQLKVTSDDLGHNGAGTPPPDIDTVDITVNPDNDAPDITVPGPQTVPEDDSLNFGNAISVFDVDVGSGDVRVDISVDPAKGSLWLGALPPAVVLSFSTGDGIDDAQIVFTGSVTAVNTALDGLIYRPLPNFDETDILSINVNDLGGSPAPAKFDLETVTINVTPENDDPVVTFTHGDQEIDEESSTGPLSFTVTDVDHDIVSQVTVSLTSSNDALIPDADPAPENPPFLDLQGTGVNRTVEAAPEEDENGSTFITITAVDALGGTGSATFKVTVENVNDPPAITEPSADPTVNEDTGVAPAHTLTMKVGDVEQGFSGVQTSIINNTNNALFSNIEITNDGLETRTLTYSPEPDASGTAQVTVQAYDGQSCTPSPACNTDTHVFLITVLALNDPPEITVPGAQSVLEDGSLDFATSISVLDVDALTADIETRLEVDHGIVNATPTAGLNITDNGTGDVRLTGTVAEINLGLAGLTYEPGSDYNGPELLTVTTDDQGSTGCCSAEIDQKTVVITVNPDNDDPVADNDTDTTLEDTQLVVTWADLFANDIDIDSPQGGWSVSSVGSETNGTATNVPGSSWVTFDPTGDFNGTASFEYTLSDGTGGSDTATVTITVTPDNDDPSAVADSASATEDVTLLIDWADLFTNDSDIDSPNSGWTVSSVSGSSNGVATNLAGSEQVRFVPTADYFGTGSFTYTLSDGHGGSDTALVTVTIASDNDDPTALADSDSVVEDNILTIAWSDLFSNDTDIDSPSGNWSVSSVGAESNGTATNLPGSFQVQFTPTLNFNGTASFDYTLDDGDGGSATATVTVTVTADNDDPIAVADSDSTLEDTQLFILWDDLFDNDSDVDSLEAGWTVSSVGNFVNCTATNLPGTTRVQVDPALNHFGTASFDYTLSDGDGGSGTATVTVTVSAVNDNPDAQNDSDATNEDQTLLIDWADLFSNDSDPDSPVGNWSISLVNGASNGIATNLPGSSQVQFVPTPNFNGSASFVYTVIDGDGGSGSATVTINVISDNDAPIAADDSDSTVEDTALLVDWGDLFVNDSDVDSPIGSWSVSSVSGATNGVATNLPGSSQVQFDPTLNFFGTASFIYTLSDGDGGDHTATVTITVTSDNDAPVALGNSDSTVEDTQVIILWSTLFANDNDVDSPQGGWTVSSTSGDSNGTSTNQPGSSRILFQPTPDFSGTASFVYTLSDGDGGSDTATVTITVSADNDDPDAVADSATTNEDTQLVLLWSTLFGNDSDVDSPQGGWTITSVSGDTNGTATNQAGSSRVLFDPTAQFNGTASFVYTLDDGHGATDTATVTITVTPDNDDPIAVNDTATTTEDTQLVIDWSDLWSDDTDIDSPNTGWSISAVSGASNGVATNLPGTSEVQFDPATNFFGTASFVYTLSDGDGGSDTATVTITVTGDNDDPIATNDSTSTSEDNALFIDWSTLWANDGDVDSPQGGWTISAVSGAINGVATNQPGSSRVEFVPATNFFGTASFIYTLDDGDGATDTATVTITVTADNDDPVAAPDSDSTTEDLTLLIDWADLFTNDNDVDSPQGGWTVSLVSGSTNGVATNLTGSSQVQFAPTPNFFGAASFVYTLADGDGGTATATVTINVVSDNDDPIAVNDSDSTVEDTQLVIDWSDLFLNDSDVDSGPGSWIVSAVSGETNGTATNAPGSQRVVFDPASNFFGTASFVYTLEDPDGATANATVTVTVTSDNDDPIAGNDTATTNEDTQLVILWSTLFGNDSDVETPQANWTVTSVSGDTNGIATNEPGSERVLFDPTLNFFGTASFVYTLTDADGGSDTATVTITVDSDNDDPVAAADTATTNEDTPVVIAWNTLFGNDSDVESPQGSWIVSSVGSESNGVATNQPGSSQVVFAPTADFNGTATFEYTLEDPDGGTDNATVTVTVDPANDDPDAVDDSDSTDEDTQVVITWASLFANDTDIDSPPGGWTVSSVSGATNGVAVNLELSSLIEFDPTPNFNGIATFDYTLSDGHGGTDTATVTITVDPDNDDPIATDDSTSTTEDMQLLVDWSTLFVNDSDIDSPQVGWSISLADNALNGVVTNLPGSSQVQFDPTPNFAGLARFDYTLSDGNGGTDSATVTITVNPDNDDPIAVDDTDSTNEDEQLIIEWTDLWSDDTDIDSADTGWSISSVGSASNGVAVNLPGSSQVQFDPVLNFAGTASFDYTLSDGDGGSDTATVTITVNEINDDPTAASDTAATNEDVQVLIDWADLFANDSDVDSPQGGWTITSVGSESNGTATNLAGSSQVQFDPALDFVGNATFEYTLDDGESGSATATVTVVVGSDNDAPIANDDSDTTVEDTPLLIDWADLFDNDEDVDSPELSWTITSVSGASNGVATNLPGSSQVQFAPTSDFFGSASFIYTLNDGDGASDNATVTITVTSDNDDPVAANDSDSTSEDITLLIDWSDLWANDGDVDSPQGGWSVSGVSGSTNGVATNLPGSSQVQFVPTSNFNGSGSFVYTLADGDSGSDTATVTITIDPINDDPTVVDDGATTLEDTQLVIAWADLFATATDIDSPQAGWSIASVSSPINGVAVLQVASSEIDFNPTLDFNGTASFDYTLADGDGGSATATVTVTVTPDNDDPIAANDSVSGDEDTTSLISWASLFANDSDIDSAVGGWSISAVDTDINGVVTNLPGTSQVQFVPATNFNGPASFDYTLSDGHGATDTATVTLTIDASNDDPDPVDDGVTTDEDTQIVIDWATLYLNDSDVDSAQGGWTVSWVGTAVNGSVNNLPGSSQVSFDPTDEFFGTASFVYTLDDGDGGTANATVTVTVTSVLDDPVAEDDTGSTGEDVAILFDWSDLFINDHDVDSPQGSWTVSAVSGATNGVATNLPGMSQVRFTPTLDFNGTASFIYTLDDGDGGTDDATVTIAVSASNDDPLAGSDSDTTVEDTQLLIDWADLFANDSDVDSAQGGWTISWVGSESDGTATNLPGSSQVQYDPPAEFYGIATFVYTLDDGHGGSDNATVTITVSSDNDSPTANDDGDSTSEDTPVVIAWTALFSNDSDIDSPSSGWTVASVSAASNGVAVNQVGSSDIEFSPTADFNGTASFDYTLSDGHGGTDTATVTIAVGAVNDDPIAVDDSDTTLEDNQLVIAWADLLSNDSDIDSPSGGFSISSVSGASNGVAVNQVGSSEIEFQPTADFNGTASFDYTLSDGNGGSATATVTITVTPDNDDPIAGDDSSSGSEGVTLFISYASLFSNDTDIDSPQGGWSISAVGSESNGVATNQPGSSQVQFVPTADFNGVASFDYTLDDGDSGSDTATVTITISSINDDPVAVDDTASTSEDIAILIDWSALFANDTDIDSPQVGWTVVWVGSAVDGTVVNLPGSTEVSFTPDDDFHGTARFVYTLDDGDGATDSATVTVTVTSVLDDPVAAADTASTSEDTAVTIDWADLFANDFDVDSPSVGWAVSFAGGESNGVATNLPGTSQVRFEPDDDFNGTASFIYTLDDGDGGSDDAVVTITVSASNDNPVASDDGDTTLEDTPILVDWSALFTNDTDIDSPQGGWTVSWVGGESNGTATNLPGSSQVQFQPAADFNGTATFVYTLDDGDGGFDNATVTIAVDPDNDDPAANDDIDSTLEDTQLVVDWADLVVNDTDIDSPSAGWSISAVGSETNGTATNLPGSEQITFDPDDDFNGTATFVYTLSDGDGGTDTATLTITVNPDNDDPIADDDTDTTQEDVTLTSDWTDLFGNDTDIDSDSAGWTVSSVGSPTNGLVNNLVGTEQVQFIPTADFQGTASYVYTLSDGHGGSDTATVTITVNPHNDDPVAEDDTDSTLEDTQLLIDWADLFANDSDIDSAQIGWVVSAVGSPTNCAVLNLPGSGQVQLDPTSDFNGLATFVYTLDDGDGGSADATVTVTVGPDNDDPIADDDSDSTDEDTPLLISWAELFTNDIDIDSPQANWLVASVSSATNGVATNLPGSEQVSFAPTGNYNGTGTFVYTLDDNDGGSDTATVTITIDPVNDDPTAVADSVATTEDTQLLIDWADLFINDDDVDSPQVGWTITAVASASNGVAVNLPGSSQVQFDPADDFFGNASFDYTLDDGDGGSADATVTITVNADNDPPEVTFSSITLNEEALRTLSNSFLASTDIDDSDGALEYEITGLPGNGTLRYGPNADETDPLVVQNQTFTQADIDGATNHFTYEHDGLENSSDSFTFTVSDDEPAATSGTFDVTVINQNDLPEVAVNNLALSENTAKNITTAELLATDEETTDADIVYRVSSTPVYGLLVRDDGTRTVLGVGGSFTQGDVANLYISYEHDGSEFPTDAASFIVSDDNAPPGAVGITLDIDINLTNDIPDVTSLGLTVDEEEPPVSFGTVELTATDDDGPNPLEYTITTATAYGTLRNASGVLGYLDTFTQADLVTGLSYEHLGAHVASDFFEFDVSDGLAAVADSFVITVNLSNDSPIVVNQTMPVAEGDPDNPVEVTVTDSFLLGSDEETSAALLQFEVRNAFSHGILRLNGNPISDGDTFTQWDVTNSRLTYEHGGAENSPETIDLTLRDADLASVDFGLTINVALANDAPIVANGGLTVAEGNPDSPVWNLLDAGDLSASDEETVDDRTLTFTVDTTVANGTLRVGSTVLGDGDSFTQANLEDNQVTYEHDGEETTSDEFEFTVTDGVNPVTGTFAIVVTPVNDAPVVVTNLVMDFIEESDTRLVNDPGEGIKLAASDPDSNDSEIRYQLVIPPSNGTLSLPSCDESCSLTSWTQAEIDDLSYIHDGSDTESDSFTFDLFDTHVPPAAATSNTNTFTINIITHNDPPELAVLEPLVGLLEGESGTIDAVLLEIDDEEQPDSEIKITIETGPTHGTLQYCDPSCSPLGSTDLFMSDITAGRLQYQHDDGEEHDDQFTFTASDQVASPDTGLLGETVFLISVTAVNDEPVIDVNERLEAHFDTIVVIPTTVLSASDAEGDPITFTITDGPDYGQIRRGPSTITTTFTQADLEAGNVYYFHLGGQELLDEVTYTVTDPSLDGPEVTMGIDILHQDCAHNWGGGAVVDACLICEDDGSSCAPVTGLTATPALGTITLTWDASPSDEVYSYNVYMDSAPSPIANVIENGSSTYSHVINVDSSSIHFFQVTTVNSATFEGTPAGISQRSLQQFLISVGNGSAIGGTSTGVFQVRLTASEPVGSFSLDITDDPDLLDFLSADHPSFTVNASDSGGVGTVSGTIAPALALADNILIAEITVGVDVGPFTVATMTPDNMTLNGGSIVPDGEAGLFTRIEPGALNCPFDVPYTGPLFGLRPGVGEDFLVAFCSLEAEPGNLIQDFAVTLLDETSGATYPVFSAVYPGGENYISAASIVCSDGRICTAGRIDSEKLVDGDWTLSYEATFETGGTAPSYPFTRLNLLQSILRLIDAIETVKTAIAGGNASLAASLSEIQDVLVHARYALEADEKPTVRAALSWVNNQLQTNRDNGDVNLAYKTFLNLQLTEVNRALIIAVDEFVFSGTASTDTTPAGDRYSDAVAFEDASANGNPSASLREAALHYLRNTNSRMALFESRIASGASNPLANVTALYTDISVEANSLYDAIVAANFIHPGVMMGEAEMLLVRDLVDQIRTDMALAGAGSLDNEGIAYMINDQFVLIELLRDASEQHIGTWLMRQRAIYGVYSAVRVVIPNAAENIAGGYSNPLTVEANRRWDTMADEIDSFLDPTSPDYLKMSRLVGFVVMATAGLNDWLTLGDPDSPAPSNGLGTESNRCFIGQFANGAYVPGAKLPKGSDSLEYYPTTEPIVFPGCGYDPCTVNWIDPDPSCP